MLAGSPRPWYRGTKYDIRDAAKDLFVEELGDRIDRPYRAEWQHFNSLFVYGPAAELDWLEGIPTCEKHQIAVVAFNGSSCTLHVYNRYQPALGVKTDHCRFLYADPSYPDKTIDWLMRIVDHHDLLREVEKDEYNSFVFEQRRKGRVIVTLDDIPEGRYPK